VVVGFYADRVFPWLMDRVLAKPSVMALRTELLSGARGRVLEIGIGTGLNLPCYPPEVQRVVAVEPNPGMADRARKRAEAVGRTLEVHPLHGEALPFPDASFDTVVSTFTLCSIADVDGALREIRRVLVPDGRFLLLEHGLADDASVRAWQHRLTPIQRVLGCGCELDRDITAIVTRSGLQFARVRSLYQPGDPRAFGYFTLGEARPPGGTT
jgi:ubiquinone/menaquinone biosynthesis C-methylase UbiE